uniref:SMP-30/Gluconolactonase/LRE-like region domain-containing protein n=1 Tax=Timema tahoe TaxID=61484 RepID=A0A7R9FKQ9_9NEOP|nr:unnamed protein product [Timema tahoe]
MGINIEPVGATTTLGEGPHWDNQAKVLYYVDITNSTVNKYDPATKKLNTVKIEGGPVSLVVPIKGKKEQFVISVGRNIAILTWDGKSTAPTKVETLCSVDSDEDKIRNRFNDGKVDPTGRLWAGTMGPESKPAEVELGKGSLFSFSKDLKTPTTHLTNISIANGLAWPHDRKTMYYIDSLDLSVDALDYDKTTGKISNRRKAFDFKTNGIDAFPDGMTIDTDGNLWVACFKAGQLDCDWFQEVFDYRWLGPSVAELGSYLAELMNSVHYLLSLPPCTVIQVNPRTGQLLSTVSVPSPQTTSVVFGGENLDELYITSANNHLSQEEQKKYPYAGYTFRVTGVGAKGYPMEEIQL